MELLKKLEQFKEINCARILIETAGDGWYIFVKARHDSGDLLTYASIFDTLEEAVMALLNGSWRKEAEREFDINKLPDANFIEEGEDLGDRDD